MIFSLSGRGVVINEIIFKGNLLQNEAVFDERCQGSGLMLQNEAVADGRC